MQASSFANFGDSTGMVPALCPLRRNEPDLGAGEPVPHLVRDRSPRRRGDGRARHHPRDRRRARSASVAMPRLAEDRRRRPRADRRDRARDAARRDRLPDLARRRHRPGQPLRASGHDQQRRARYVPVGPAHPGGRPICWPTSIACWPRSSGARRSSKYTPTIGRSHGIHAEPTQLRPQARRALR